MLRGLPAVPEPGPALPVPSCSMSRKRLGGSAGKLLCLFLILGTAHVPSPAAPGGRDFGRTVPDVRSIDDAEAAEVMQEFRASRGGLDSILESTLAHYPRSGRKTVRNVEIRTGWDGPVLSLRVDWKDEANGESVARRFLFRAGSDPAGWAWDPEKEKVVALEREDFLRPLVPGMDITAFDLTAPYLDWSEFSYDGSERVSGSPAHWFRFVPPPAWEAALADAGIDGVRVALDTRFDAPIRVEYLGPGTEVRRTLEARSFKKISDTWIVRRLEAFDEKSRDRTELTVEDAVVEISLPRSVFHPNGLSGAD